MKTSDAKARGGVGDMSHGYVATAKVESLKSLEGNFAHTDIYIYIYIYRERERERDFLSSVGVICSLWLVGEASAV